MAQKHEQFGHYLIVDNIDQSINSRISLAVKPDYHQYVALKQISPNRVTHDGFREIFANEGWISAHLDHQNIPKIVERGYDGANVPFMSFEYVSGISLQKAINSLKKIEKTIPLSLTLYIFRELASTLQYVHTRHEIHHGSENTDKNNTGHAGPEYIVHCDLNPKNVILGFDGSIYLIDFGIACTSLTKRPPETLNGTFNFMSPEQVKGLTVDNRSDIFSLSEMMYCALAGVPPFDADTDLGIVERLRTGDFSPLEKVNSQIPATLGRIVHRGLQSDPEHRFQTMQSLGESIENFRSISRIHYTTKQFSRWLTSTFSSTYNEEQRKLSELPTMLVECAHMSIKTPMRLELVENAISKTAIFNPSPKKTLHGVGENGASNFIKKQISKDPLAKNKTDRDLDHPRSDSNQLHNNAKIAASERVNNRQKNLGEEQPETVAEQRPQKQASQNAEHTKVDDESGASPGEMWDDGPTLLDDDQDDQIRRIVDARRQADKKKSEEITTVGVPITKFDPTIESTNKTPLSKRQPLVSKRPAKPYVKDDLYLESGAICTAILLCLCGHFIFLFHPTIAIAKATFEYI